MVFGTYRRLTRTCTRVARGGSERRVATLSGASVFSCIGAMEHLEHLECSWQPHTIQSGFALFRRHACGPGVSARGPRPHTDTCCVRRVLLLRLSAGSEGTEDSKIRHHRYGLAPRSSARTELLCRTGAIRVHRSLSQLAHSRISTDYKRDVRVAGRGHT